MYEEKPATVVVMPPINQTTHAEAKDYFYSTLYESLCEKGYYVYPSYLTLQLFQQESAYDAEMFLENDLSSFRNMLGADAAMFTIIKNGSAITWAVRLRLKLSIYYAQQKQARPYIRARAT